MIDRAKITERIVRNPIAKLFSLALAILLVWLVRQDTIREVDLRVPLRVLMPEKDKFLLSDPPDEVSLRLRGPWSKLVELLQQNIQAYVVDVSNMPEGGLYKFRVEELADHLNLDSVSVLAVMPQSFDIEVDSFTTARVKVQPNVQGSHSKYVYIDYAAITVEPSVVEVTGPSSVLLQLSSLMTRPIDVSGMDQSYETRISVEMPASKGLKVVPESVKVVVPLRDKVGAKALADVPVPVVDCPAGFTCLADPKTFSVSIQGVERVLDTITRANVGNDIYLDAGGIRAPSDNMVTEIYGPVEPVIRERDGIRYELDGSNRYFKIKLRRRRAP